MDLWETRAKAATSGSIDQRLLRPHGWLERSRWISCIRKGVGSSIRAFEFFQDILLEPRGFLNTTFALQCPQFRCFTSIQLHHVCLVIDYGWGQEYEQVKLH